MKNDIDEDFNEFQSKERQNTQMSYESGVANENRPYPKKNRSLNKNIKYITFTLGSENHKAEASTVFDACPLISKNENIHRQKEVIIIHYK